MHLHASHRRRNPLTGEWVLVSPQRMGRPWQGQMETPQAPGLPTYDPTCYLCPGNGRTSGIVNPQYASVFVFDNDFQALSGHDPQVQRRSDGLLQAEPEFGICRVLCYNPRHDLTLARMTPEQILPVIAAWQQEYATLGAREDISHVQIFENRGRMMGCSNPHPHGQIWATGSIPHLPGLEDRFQREHLQQQGSCLLCDYLQQEVHNGERLVLENAAFVALVPYWAVWPFELLVLPRRHQTRLTDLRPEESRLLAELLGQVCTRYDNLFSTSFPYSMGVHQQPTDDGQYDHWHWHMHFYPPLLRSAEIRKFMVGFEMLAMPQRDITAEESARRLRELPDRHYLETL